MRSNVIRCINNAQPNIAKAIGNNAVVKYLRPQTALVPLVPCVIHLLPNNPTKSGSFALPDGEGVIAVTHAISYDTIIPESESAAPVAREISPLQPNNLTERGACALFYGVIGNNEEKIDFEIASKLSRTVSEFGGVHITEATRRLAEAGSFIRQSANEAANTIKTKVEVTRLSAAEQFQEISTLLQKKTGETLGEIGEKADRALFKTLMAASTLIDSAKGFKRIAVKTAQKISTDLNKKLSQVNEKKNQVLSGGFSAETKSKFYTGMAGGGAALGILGTAAGITALNNKILARKAQQEEQAMLAQKAQQEEQKAFINEMKNRFEKVEDLDQLMDAVSSSLPAFKNAITSNNSDLRKVGEETLEIVRKNLVDAKNLTAAADKTDPQKRDSYCQKLGETLKSLEL